MISLQDNVTTTLRLAELLILVAIIGVLVAISIPIFTSQLEKAREATDVANMRAAKAEASADYLSADLDTTVWKVTGTTATAYYDAAKGVMVKDAPTNKYGKGTKADGKTSYDGYEVTGDYTSSAIKAEVNTETGAITISWDPAPTKA